jgi:hypothetical protein
MSRFAFGTIFTDTEDEFVDVNGYEFFDWESHGVVGYDEELQSYFANLEGSSSIGTSPSEITTITEFQRKLTELFQGANLPFHPPGLERLSEGVA